MHPTSPPRRGYGILLLVNALCWLTSIVLAWLAAFGAILALLRSTQDQLDSADLGGSVSALGAAALAMLVGSAVLLLIGLALDIWMTVASAQRLRGGRGDRVIPVIALVSVTLSLVLPVLLSLLFVGALSADLTRAADVMAWCLAALLLGIGPLARLTQGVAGLVRTATGESAPQYHLR